MGYSPWGCKGRTQLNDFAFAFFTFPGGSDGKASACNVVDLGSIPGSGRSPEGGNGYPLQYSFLENSMDGGAWWATVHGVTKSRTRLSDLTHSLNLIMFLMFPFPSRFVNPQKALTRTLFNSFTCSTT